MKVLKKFDTNKKSNDKKWKIKCTGIKRDRYFKFSIDLNCDGWCNKRQLEQEESIVRVHSSNISIIIWIHCTN